LASQGDVDADANFNLTAALLTAEGTAQGTAATLPVTFDAVDEPSLTAPTQFPNYWDGTSGDDAPSNATTEGYVSGAAWRVNAYGGNDEIWYDLRGYAPAPLVIDAGDGSDEVTATSSENRIFGGDGNDLIAAYGNNTLEGGAGSDILSSGYMVASEPTGDRVYGDREILPALAITQGETDAGSVAVGDLLSSGDTAARDLFVGTAARDVLAGGGGEDTLIAGAGDDLIMGDRYIYIQYSMPSHIWPSFQWDWHTSVSTNEGGAAVYSHELTNSVQYRVSDGQGNLLSSTGNLREETLPGAADTIYAGAGNDTILSDDGDDFVDAGSGDDTRCGELPMAPIYAFAA
jgi:Ca2+-binding RTX toxin-like protein